MATEPSVVSKPTRARAERLALLTQTGVQSAMGQLLRKFWHPIGLSNSVQAGKAIRVRMFGETLTLYRGKSGKAYLVGGECAHRRTLLHTGWVEGENIRCMYHGWQYGSDGRCIDRPAERSSDPHRIKIPSYATREYCGVVFVYLGAGEPPEFDLPRKERFEAPDTLIFARSETWDCNWLQNIENSLDPVHVSFAHQMGKVGAFGEAITGDVPELKYEETDSGICQMAIRPGNRVRVSDFTFPNYNHVMIPGPAPGDPWLDVGHWMVANDDGHTTRIAIFAAPKTSPEVDKRLTEYFARVGSYKAADHHDELFRGEYPADPLIELTSAQDYVAIMGQGTIADHENEMLGQSDAGVARLRAILWREMDALRQGQNGKKWRRAEQALTPGGVERVA